MTDPARLARVGRLGLAGLALAAVVAALWAMGGPFAGQAEARDAARRQDLNRLADFVQCVADSSDGHLPETLAPDARCMSEPPLVDIRTGAAYRYEVTSPQGFRLCADFEQRANHRTDPWNYDSRKRIFDPVTGCLNVNLVRP